MPDRTSPSLSQRSNTILKRVEERVSAALARCGFDGVADVVRFSDRTDISDFQSNVSFRLAKLAAIPPARIAEDLAAALRGDSLLDDVRVDGGGFVNFRLSNEFLCQYLTEISNDEKFGVAPTEEPIICIVDYGGPNVAKSMHVGHLRSTIIGDCLCRLFRFLGHRVIGDVHLGDWGTQMGMLIHELSLEEVDLVYFDSEYRGPYPEDPPITLSQLETMYPAASSRCKSNSGDMASARLATAELQAGREGYVALWKHFVSLSKASLKRDFDFLGVTFDLWWGESTVHARIQGMVESLRRVGLAIESEGAVVVPVSEPGDKVELPPLILEKSDGAVMYGTTDLATLDARFSDLGASKLLYVVDERQKIHFEQVFRAASKAGFCQRWQVEHIGFGTVNGPDGKPFKTRSGGVMKLSALLTSAYDKARERLADTRSFGELSIGEVTELSKAIANAALKFADLSNHRLAAYSFDLDRFVSFEGKTGPYIQYTVARINSMLMKARERGTFLGLIAPAELSEERELQISLTQFADTIDAAFVGRAPNIICERAYKLAQQFSRFYASCHILTEESGIRQASWLALSKLTKDQLSAYLHILGIVPVERM